MTIKQEWQDALNQACDEARAGKRDARIWFEKYVILICLNEVGGVEVELEEHDKALFEELSVFCRELSATGTVIGTKGVSGSLIINFKAKGKR